MLAYWQVDEQTRGDCEMIIIVAALEFATEAKRDEAVALNR